MLLVGGEGRLLARRRRVEVGAVVQVAEPKDVVELRRRRQVPRAQRRSRLAEQFWLRRESMCEWAARWQETKASEVAPSRSRTTSPPLLPSIPPGPPVAALATCTLVTLAPCEALTYTERRISHNRTCR